MCSFTFLSSRVIKFIPSFILGKLFLEKTPALHPAFLTPLPLITFTTKKSLVGLMKQLKVVTKLQVCFVSHFTVSVTHQLTLSK